MSKKQMLKIFPGIEEQWNIDNGKALMEEYFELQSEQAGIRKQWNAAREAAEESVLFFLADAECMQIRLLPFELDEREPFTEEASARLHQLLNRGIGKRNGYDFKTYREIMEILTSYKTSDELNSLLMGRRVLKRLLLESLQPAEHQTFEVEIETGEVLEATLLACIEAGGKDYAVYALPNEKGTSDILASYIQKDEDGFDTLVDIDHPQDKKMISDVISDLIEKGELL